MTWRWAYEGGVLENGAGGGLFAGWGGVRGWPCTGGRDSKHSETVTQSEGRVMNVQLERLGVHQGKGVSGVWPCRGAAGGEKE